MTHNAETNDSIFLAPVSGMCPSVRERFFGWGSKNWTTFRLGKQNLVKNNQDNQIQTSKY